MHIYLTASANKTPWSFFSIKLRTNKEPHTTQVLCSRYSLISLLICTNSTEIYVRFKVHFMLDLHQICPPYWWNISTWIMTFHKSLSEFYEPRCKTQLIIFWGKRSALNLSASCLDIAYQMLSINQTAVITHNHRCQF